MSETNNVKVLADRQDIVAIANAVRNKTGKTNGMTLGAIATNINGISVGGTEDLDAVLDAQEAKIAELSALLDTKAAGGGGVETCTLTINNRSNVTISSFVYLTEPGYYATVEGVGAYGIYTYTVLCGSLIYVMYSGTVNIATDNVEYITGYPVDGVLYMVTAGSGETATITVTLGGTNPA